MLQPPVMPSRAFYLAALASLLLSAACGTEAPRPSGGVSGAGGGGIGAGGLSSVSRAGASSGGVGAAGAAPIEGFAGGGAGLGGFGVAGSLSLGGGGGESAGGGGPGKLSGMPIVYVGGFGDFALRAFDLDKTSGALTPRGQGFASGSSPSSLALDPSRTHLYTSNEDDGKQGGVTANAINADGSLTRLNHQSGSDRTPAPSCAPDGCGFVYVAVDPSGKYLLAASYDGGSVSSFPIARDGSLGPELDMLDFGDSAEAHCVAFDVTGKYLFVPTLGEDRVQQLLLGPGGMLLENTPPSVATAAGTGPRHIALHPNGKLAFVANEAAASLTPYRVAEGGQLTPGTSVSSLPPGATGARTGAHVELSPDGRFVYGQNRGDKAIGGDSIAAYSVDPSSGALTLIEHQPVGGKTLWDFDVDPNGELLVAASEGDGTLSVFQIGADGGLTPLGTPTKVSGQPTSVLIHYLK
jgi:6-phosphogluconolactonase